MSKVVKVLDFGIAGGVDATRLTQAGEVFGTPQYMSPEQCNGLPLDHRTDIYSLGCILYEMIEGRPPFSAETPMATMLKHVRAKVPAPRRAGTETARVMLMSLRKDRSKRIQTAGRFAELIGHCIGALRALKEGRGPTAARRFRCRPRTKGFGADQHERIRDRAAGVGSMGGHSSADRNGCSSRSASWARTPVVALLVFGNLGNGTKSDTTPRPRHHHRADQRQRAEDSPLQPPLVRANVPAAKVFVAAKSSARHRA